jgi:hypothetical protein
MHEPLSQADELRERERRKENEKPIKENARKIF